MKAKFKHLSPYIIGRNLSRSTTFKNSDIDFLAEAEILFIIFSVLS